ncbi:hypothetical protein C0995_012118, partial [Termitomyces sp. Mi166
MTVESADIPFNLDYIVYTPSFTSLSETESSGLQTSTPSSSGQPQAGMSHGKLLGAIIGPVLSGIIIVLILLLMRRKKLPFWSSIKRPTPPNTGMITINPGIRSIALT